MITIAAACAMGIVADRSDRAMILGVAWLALVIFGRLIRSNASVRWGCLLLLIAGTSAARSRWDENRYQNASIRELITEELQPAIVVGEITGLIQRTVKPGHSTQPSDNDKSDDSPWLTRFNLEITSLRHGRTFRRCDGRLWVSIDGDVAHLSTGDTVKLAGNLAAFLPPTNPGETDRRAVARNHRQHGRLFVRDPAQVETINQAAWGVRRIADQISRQGEQTLVNCLGEQTGALASALVVGRRGSLDPALQDQLLETGTIHLLSVSGLHMGIVAMVIRLFATFLGMRGWLQLAFVGSCCVLFVAVTGARPPVLRAAMLVGVVLAAGTFERQSLPLNSLAFAAIVLMFINPTDVTRVGVQLSFIAVATLVSCGQRYRDIDEELLAEAQLDRLAQPARWPVVQRLRQWKGKLSNAIWFSLCVTLTTTPLVWMHFNLVTPIAIVANVLLGIPMTVALLSGLVAVIAGAISPWLALPAGQACLAALLVMQWVIDMAAQISWGHFWLPSPPPWWVASYYALLLAGFWLPRKWNRSWLFMIGSILWCVVAWWLCTLPARHSSTELRATFLDVGHGTSVIIQLPDGRRLLYDCGSLGNQNHSSLGFHEPLWELGITSLDAVIVSHADADHYNALPGLLRRFHVNELVVPAGMFDQPKEGLRPIRQAVEAAGVPIRNVSREDPFLDRSVSPDAHGQAIEILHPPPYRVPGNDNANSLVLRIDVGDRSLILPGDLESPGLEMVINQPRPRPGGVLMSPHHGSLTTDSSAMLDWARPRQVVVSGGTRAKRPEVIDALRIRGSDVYVTAEVGAILVVMPAVISPGPGIGFSPLNSPAAASTGVRAWRTDPW